jgi:3-hydroxyisobutyrate dehydrogenase-like beta-hydroxyacid dehydrogenase
MVPPSFQYSAPMVPGLQWYGGDRTELQGKELGQSARLGAHVLALRKGLTDLLSVLGIHSGRKTIVFTGVLFGDNIDASHRNARHRSNGVVMDGNPIRQIALLGFGEVGGIFGQDFAAAGLDVCTFDILLNMEPSRSAMRAKAKSANVRPRDTLEQAVRGADLVISAVTASSAAGVARASVPFLCGGQIYMDLNSVSPETKREIGRILSESPSTFVEAAVMAPVSPQRLKVPMLLGGAYATTAAKRLQAIGLNVKPISDRIGVASAVKMCRSIIIKGLEAITVESMFTARRYGAEKQVLESVAATFPGLGWDGALPNYLISRVAEHGKRRAAEMREAAKAVADAGLEPLTALATAQRQDWLAQVIAEYGLAVPKGEAFSWQELADAIAEVASPHEKSSAGAKQ